MTNEELLQLYANTTAKYVLSPYEVERKQLRDTLRDLEMIILNKMKRGK